MSADKRYSISSFVNHSQRKYTPFFVITPAFFDLHTCMVVAQLRRHGLFRTNARSLPAQLDFR
ncbi:hypothetical protein DRW31_19940 [Shigella dysenteriae]|uniref:Uncharacterized protein n=1 Tax=Shigella dysenteriae TaxID=622 RepID=A0A403M7I6_SHIDY|nr:hypothetical protein [Shigella dysenteriae]MLU14504.1 hypothetical protein [Shigella dysenteriae]